MKHLIYTLSILIATCSLSFAQKIKVVKGDPGIIKGERVHVTYDFSDMRVGKKSEADYLEQKVQDYNQKEPGKGDKWAKAWVDDRKHRFLGKFEELLNKNFEGTDTEARNAFKETKYVMNVHTTWTEPGYNIGISKRPAKINLIITISEVASEDELVAITLDGAPGKTFGYGDFDTGVRIQEAYAKAGKELAQFIVKKYF